MKKSLFLVCFAAVVFLLATTASATGFWSSYNYMEPPVLKQILDAGGPVILLDIQVEEGFSKHHIPGAKATFAYPVKTAKDRMKLDAALAGIRSGKDPVVIVCPRGGGGAKRAYDHLAENGLPVERLYILENGQEGWPYPELTEKTIK